MPSDDHSDLSSDGEPLAVGRLISPEPKRKLRVVLGVDPEQSLEGTIATLRQLAGHGLELHVVHVFDPRSGDADLAKCRAALEAEGLGGTWIYRGSDPARGLIAAARNQAADIFDADLLIMGTKPHCFLDRLLSGSISFDEIVSGSRSIFALRA
ncbi:MAG: universal stress protein [Fimbriimonas sp.]